MKKMKMKINTVGAYISPNQLTVNPWFVSGCTSWC